MENFKYSYLQSPIGKLLLVRSRKGLKHIVFERNILRFFHETNSKQDCNELIEDNTALELIKQQLEEYFCEKRYRFKIQLDISVPPFYLKVMQEVLTIPYGKVRSYKEIADRINNPKAFRAVGSANANNTIPIIIPCHRVISHRGALGGYGGGLKIKKYLLKNEGVI